MKDYEQPLGEKVAQFVMNSCLIVIGILILYAIFSDDGEDDRREVKQRDRSIAIKERGERALVRAGFEGGRAGFWAQVDIGGVIQKFDPACTHEPYIIETPEGFFVAHCVSTIYIIVSKGEDYLIRKHRS